VSPARDWPGSLSDHEKYSTGLAIGVVGFRVAEGILEILGGVITIGLLALSQEFVKAGAPDAAYFQTIGAIIKAETLVEQWRALLLWCIGALMYYTVFYQYRIVRAGYPAGDWSASP